MEPDFELSLDEEQVAPQPGLADCQKQLRAALFEVQKHGFGKVTVNIRGGKVRQIEVVKTYQ